VAKRKVLTLRSDAIDSRRRKIRDQNQGSTRDLFVMKERLQFVKHGWSSSKKNERKGLKIKEQECCDRNRKGLKHVISPCSAEAGRQITGASFVSHASFLHLEVRTRSSKMK
jgi:hypothetical protein